MTAPKAGHIFISYSHHDEKIVGLLAQLVRAVLAPLVQNAVFLDRQQLEFGQPWPAQLQKAIATSEQVFVFWCEHSAASAEVKKEWRYAVGKGKRVVPVLLDRTPLSRRLASVHGVDLIAAGLHGDSFGIHASGALAFGTSDTEISVKVDPYRGVRDAVRALAIQLGGDPKDDEIQSALFKAMIR